MVKRNERISGIVFLVASIEGFFTFFSDLVSSRFELFYVLNLNAYSISMAIVLAVAGIILVSRQTDYSLLTACLGVILFQFFRTSLLLLPEPFPIKKGELSYLFLFLEYGMICAVCVLFFISAIKKHSVNQRRRFVSSLVLFGLIFAFFICQNYKNKDLVDTLSILVEDHAEVFLISLAFVFFSMPLAGKKQIEHSDYIGIGDHFVLYIVTFGIWHPFWLYRTTKFCNKLDERDQHKPLSQTVLCLLVPFYQCYWFYKQAKKLESAMNETVKTDLSAICLLFSPVFPIISSAILQENINRLAEGSFDDSDIPEI